MARLQHGTQPQHLCVVEQPVPPPPKTHVPVSTLMWSVSPHCCLPCFAHVSTHTHMHCLTSGEQVGSRQDPRLSHTEPPAPRASPDSCNSPHSRPGASFQINPCCHAASGRTPGSPQTSCASCRCCSGARGWKSCRTLPALPAVVVLLLATAAAAVSTSSKSTSHTTSSCAAEADRCARQYGSVRLQPWCAGLAQHTAC